MEQNTEKIKISFFRETRGKILFAAALLVLLLVLMFFSWTVQLELPPISQLLFPKAGEGDGMLRKILMQIRLPRIILGALTGAVWLFPVRFCRVSCGIRWHRPESSGYLPEADCAD